MDGLREQIVTVDREMRGLNAELFPEGPRGIPFERASSGADVRAGVLGHEQRVAEWAAQAEDVDQRQFLLADAQDFCLGNIMRALVDPKFRSYRPAPDGLGLELTYESGGGATFDRVEQGPNGPRTLAALREGDGRAGVVRVASARSWTPRRASAFGRVASRGCRAGRLRRLV